MNCKICFEKIKSGSLYSLRKDACICQKCFNEFNPIFRKFKIDNIKGISIYDYDETIRKHLYSLKGCYDIELAPVFISRFIHELKLMYKGYYLVPLPSSKEDDELRGFNHVEEIFKPLNMKYILCLKKKFKFKQSDLSKEERTKIKSKLEIINKEELEGKKILIVDDVMTTGSSLEAALELVKLGRPKKIKILVLSRKLPSCNKNTNLFSFFLNKMK